MTCTTIQFFADIIKALVETQTEKKNSRALLWKNSKLQPNSEKNSSHNPKNLKKRQLCWDELAKKVQKNLQFRLKTKLRCPFAFSPTKIDILSWAEDVSFLTSLATRLISKGSSPPKGEVTVTSNSAKPASVRSTRKLITWSTRWTASLKKRFQGIFYNHTLDKLYQINFCDFKVKTIKLIPCTYSSSHCF